MATLNNYQNSKKKGYKINISSIEKSVLNVLNSRHTFNNFVANN